MLPGAEQPSNEEGIDLERWTRTACEIRPRGHVHIRKIPIKAHRRAMAVLYILAEQSPSMSPAVLDENSPTDRHRATAAAGPDGANRIPFLSSRTRTLSELQGFRAQRRSRNVCLSICTLGHNRLLSQTARIARVLVLTEAADALAVQTAPSSPIYAGRDNCIGAAF